jgi:hypothetical protein
VPCRDGAYGAAGSSIVRSSRRELRRAREEILPGAVKPGESGIERQDREPPSVAREQAQSFKPRRGLADVEGNVNAEGRAQPFADAAGKFVSRRRR